MSKQIVILGGGLAGSLLAFRLLTSGQQVTLIDDGAPASASRVAAGLFNVVTGRFGAKTWMADTLLDKLNAFFTNKTLTAYLHAVHYQKIYRPFKEVAEYNKWTSKAKNPEYAPLVRFREQPYREDVLHNPFGGIDILPCGWVDTKVLLTDLLAWFRTQPNFSYYPQEVAYRQIEVSKKSIHLAGCQISFDHLVFCEGYRASQNPFFPKLPVIPNKGELLRIEAPELQLDLVLSRKIYLIPLDNHHYLMGATYKKDFSSLLPTQEGREEMTAHLRKAIKVPFRVLDQWAGIRPTTPDRRPILGTHPTHSCVHVMSGFGTKGLLYAPYFSEIMAKHLLEGASLPAAVSLDRFG